MKHRILTLSATKVAREFYRLLDRVEAGAEVIVERHSRPVAVISPVEGAPRLISECLEIRVARPPVTPDPGFAADLKAIIEGHPKGEPTVWD